MFEQSLKERKSTWAGGGGGQRKEKDTTARIWSPGTEEAASEGRDLKGRRDDLALDPCFARFMSRTQRKYLSSPRGSGGKDLGTAMCGLVFH